MKKFLLVLLMLGMVGNVFANWDSSTDMQTLTVSAAVTQVQNSLKAIDGTSGTVPTNVNTKNLQLDGLTSGTITLTPAAIAGTTAITVPAVAGTLVTSAGTGTNIDIGAYDLRAATVTPDGLTSGRVTFATTNGTLTDDADLTFSIDTLTATKLSAPTIIGVTTLTAGGNLDIGSYELRAQTLQSDVVTGTAPLIVASTTKVTNLNADLLDGYNTATTATASSIYVSGGDGYLPDATVDTSALKTTTGEISVSGTIEYPTTLPGGEYGFWPQLKGGTAVTQYLAGILISGNSLQPLTTSYVTGISIRADGGATIYAKQRYVTASGQDHWLFILVDKTTKEIIQTYSAPDHPAYGNGGNFDKMPHPFGNYDETKCEIILVDNDTITELKTQVTEEKSLLTLVNELYKPEMSKEEVYKPLHSGKYINEDNKQVKQLIETIPDYIKVRKLNKMNQGELNVKAAKQEQTKQKAEQNKVKKEQDKISARNKLQVLGLSEDEIDMLKN